MKNKLHYFKIGVALIILALSLEPFTPISSPKATNTEDTSEVTIAPLSDKPDDDMPENN
jgi:hypothetical protein